MVTAMNSDRGGTDEAQTGVALPKPLANDLRLIAAWHGRSIRQHVKAVLTAHVARELPKVRGDQR